MSPEVSRLAALAPQPPVTPDLLDFDRDHLWHPYSSMTSPGAVYPVESASGVRLRLRRR